MTRTIAEPAPSTAQTRVSPTFLMVVATAYWAMLRLAVVVSARGPTVVPDESGTWAIARWATGGVGWDMADMPSYPLVPGIVTAPVELLAIDASARYRVALCVMAAMTFLAADVTRRTVRILTADQPLTEATAFVVVLLAPATMTTTSFTWAEASVVLVWAVLAWALVSNRDALMTRGVIVGSVATGLAPFTHGRLWALPLLWIAFLVWRTSSSTLRRGALGVVATVAVATAALAMHRAVGAAVWDADAAAGSSPAVSLSDPQWWRAIVTAAAGQIWYLCTASFGLAVVGALTLLRAIRSSSNSGNRMVGIALGAMLLATMGTSILRTGSTLHDSLVGNDALTTARWDHMTYGRYIDAVAILLSVLGVCAVASLRRPSGWRSWFVGAGGTAVVAALLSAALVDPATVRAPLPINIAGVAVMGFDPNVLLLPRWTVMSLGVMVVLVAVGQRSARTFCLTLCALLFLGGALGAGRAVNEHRSWNYSAVADVIEGHKVTGEVVSVSADAARVPSMRVSLYGFEYFLVDRGWTIEVSAVGERPSGGDVLIASAEEAPLTGYRMIDDSLVSGVVIWARAG